MYPFIIFISRACHAVECWQYQFYSFNITILKEKNSCEGRETDMEVMLETHVLRAVEMRSTS